jgi:hypothetical protein
MSVVWMRGYIHFWEKWKISFVFEACKFLEVDYALHVCNKMHLSCLYKKFF